MTCRYCHRSDSIITHTSGACFVQCAKGRLFIRPSRDDRDYIDEVLRMQQNQEARK